MLDGGIVGDNPQPEAVVMEKHSDQTAPVVAAVSESAFSDPVQAHAHTVDLHAAEGVVSCEARVRDSANISDTVAVDSAVRAAPPDASDTGVLRKMPSPKSIPARPAERDDGSVFIPASSFFPATAHNNPVEPAQSKESGDVMGSSVLRPVQASQLFLPSQGPRARTRLGYLVQLLGSDLPIANLRRK